MTRQESLFSPTATFHYFIMSVLLWIYLERKSYCRWSLRTISSQYHNNPVLVPSRKPYNPMKDFYDGQTYDLKTRMGIWTRMYVVPVQYGTFTQIFHLTMSFFQFITGINFKWDYVLWNIISLLVWIGLCTKLSIYKIPPDPVRWSCRGFEYLWRSLMSIWVLGSNDCLKVSHMK